MTEQQNKKYQFFLDETGDHGLTFIDDNFPIFLLAGCLFDDSEYQKISTEINALKQEFFKTAEVILHSRDIRKCEGAFQILFDLDIKKRFYERLNKIISDAKFTILCAYPVARHVLNSEEPYIPFAIIKNKLYCSSAAKTDGYGLKIFP